MKTEPIAQLALTIAFASMLAVTTATTQANICSSGPEPKPDVWFSCWDCPYQCHGDADCRAEGPFGYRVYTNDLAMFQAVWMSAHEWPVVYPDFAYNPCVDFDRDFDVDDCDADTMATWYKRNVPADCPGRPPVDPLMLDPLEDGILFAGQNYTVHWEDAREGGCGAHKYMLYYSVDAGENWLPTDTNSIDYTCSYEWLIPQVVSDQCLLRIDDLHDPTAITDTLDELFTIVECSGSNILYLEKPEAGQFVLADSNCTITWSDCRPSESQTRGYKLHYSTDLGKPWKPIDPNPIYALSYDWLVPPDLNGLCYLAVSDADDPTVGNIMFDGFYVYHCDEEMPADLDGNCYIDFRDYAMLVLSWPLEPDFEVLSALADQWCDCANPYDPACGY